MKFSMNQLKIFLSRSGAIFTLMLFSILPISLTSCIEDGVSTSPADQPKFSTDTVRLGSLLTLGPSPTSRFIVYNNHDKILNISDIAFRDDVNEQFRLNVDGVSARRFSNIEIRPNDSIFVFVEATLAENGQDLPVAILAHIDFKVNGVTSTMPVTAEGQDVTRLSGDIRFAENTTLFPGKPYLINDSIVVEEGAKLTIPAGSRLLMHDAARIIVYGSLEILGTPDKKVEIRGDRSGFVASTIPYEVMSGQWAGIYFAPTSYNNKISHTSIRNSEQGIILDHCGGSRREPALSIYNSVVRNTKGYIIEAIHSSLSAVGCEFSDASLGILRLVGSEHHILQSTIANYYLFTAVGPAIQFEHFNPEEDITLDKDSNSDESDKELPYLSADIENTIIYGLGSDLSHGDFTGFPIKFTNCLFKSAGEDDDNFIKSLWETDPLYGVVRESYIFDYRVGVESPTLNAGDPLLLTTEESQTDIFGASRLPSPTLGAYQEPRQ